MSILTTVPGYHARIFFNGKWVNCERNLEFLNYLSSGKFTICLNLKRGMDSTTSFSVTPIYRVEPKTKNIIPVECTDGKFEFDVPIQCNGPGKWGYTTENTVRFIAYNEKLEMCEYEVGVFSQRGQHFFLMQRNWQDRLCLNAEGSPVVENVNWDQLAKYLTSSLNIRPQGFVGEMPKKELVLPAPTADYAVVRWFKPPTGTGAIETLEGMAKVHYSDILNYDKRKPAILLPNQRVRAKLISAEEAAKNSKYRISFPWVAREVIPV